MKRYIYTILSQIFSFFLLLFLITPSSVSADVIFEPENSFYSRHSRECTYVNRNYTANGDITYRKSPDSPQAAGILENGSKLNISFVYKDSADVEWGIFENSKTGWVAMADLYLVYDSTEFTKDHASEIITGEPETLPADSTVVFWTYPESGTICHEFGELPQDITFESFYTDAGGRLWGNCGYYMGFCDFWVCLSAPENTKIEAAAVPQKIPGQAIDRTKIRPAKSTAWNTVTLIVPILLIILASVILIKKFWKRER